MKKTKILYWTFTGLFAAFMMFTAIPNILVNEDSVNLIHGQLGYPEYFIRFIGIGKALGSFAIVIPGLGRIKDWAYAGLMFDLIAATYSVWAIHTPLGDMMFLALPLAVGALSYYFTIQMEKGKA